MIDSRPALTQPSHQVNIHQLDGGFALVRSYVLHAYFYNIMS
jgi:hypothetical protein